MRATLSFALWLLFGCSCVQAQHLTAPAHTGVPSVPISEDVYLFLRHLSVRGLIDNFDESALPLSEFEITTLLHEAEGKDLSRSEIDNIKKYIRTYERTPFEAVTMFAAEDDTPFFVDGIFDVSQDKYLYRWRDTATVSDFQVNALGSLEYRQRALPESGSAVLGVIGGRFKGTLSGHVGFYMQTTNGQSFGDSSIALEDPVIGKNKNFADYSNHMFYDNTTAELAYNNDWFTGKLGRIPIAFGGGYQMDNITINPNVSLYDVVSVAAKVKSVQYHAVVASLLGEAKYSESKDSNYYRFGPGAYIDPKYLALHHVNISLGNDFDFGFTDMTIFSRRFDIAYLNPFAFLKSVEHSLNDRDNGLMAAHIRWRFVKGLEFRGQWLMDDIVASRIGDGYWGNKFAWQAGMMWAAPFGLHDVDIAAEYTQVEPYTYSHFNPQNSFVTNGMILGSQIGPNSRSLWGQIRWVPSWQWKFWVSVNHIARGENIYDSTGVLLVNYGGDVEQTIRSDEEKDRSYSLLEGNRVNVVAIEANVVYELFRGYEIFGRIYNKSVDYPGGASANPLQTPYRLFTLGARATF